MTEIVSGFEVFDEKAFEDFLKFNSSLIRPVEYTPLTQFGKDIREVINRMRSRRKFAPINVVPYYAEAHFTWVVFAEGPFGGQKIKSAALIRFPNEEGAKGEIIYIDTEETENITPLVELHELASKTAGTWEGGTFPLNLMQWKDTVNADFFKKAEEPMLKEFVLL